MKSNCIFLGEGLYLSAIAKNGHVHIYTKIKLLHTKYNCGM